MEETRGIIMFNRGPNCIVRAIVALETIRRHWEGPITFYLEEIIKNQMEIKPINMIMEKAFQVLI